VGVERATERDAVPARGRARAALAAVLVVGVLVALRALDLALRDELIAALGRLRGAGPEVAVALVAVSALATCVLVPGSVLSASFGFLFGFSGGTAVAGLGTWLGALLAYGLARTLARHRVRRALERAPRARSLAMLATHHGGMLVFLTRLSPLAPSTMMNYAFGTVEVPTRAFALGSLGLLPNVAMYAYLGSVSARLVERPALALERPIEWALAALWVGASALLIAWVGRALGSMPRSEEREKGPSS
jgi:uncharacterized membrane protein YdjX (TVP38/TMEM64 family)